MPDNSTSTPVHVSRAVCVAADGAEVRLEAGDTLDTEWVGRHVITAVADSQILVAKGAGRG